MATYSTSLQIKLITDGTESGVWGSSTNTNWNLMEQAVTGVQGITMTNADYTLSVVNGASDEARNAVLVVTGTNSAIRKIVAPLVNKIYIVFNNTTGGYAITIGGSTGIVATIPNGVTCLVYCDGTNFYNGNSGAAGNFTVSGNQSVGGNLTVTGTSTFTGIPSGPTANAGTSSTQLATTAFVGTAITNLALGTMSLQNANAVAITGGSITGITDLAVADGGTGSSSLTANAVILGNGTSAVQVVAPGTSGNVLTSNGTTWTSATPASPIGVGQTWQLPSRSLSTTYTNSTGKPIQVHVVMQANGGGGGSTTTAVVDGQRQMCIRDSSVSGGLSCVTHSFIVPDNSTYSVTAGGLSSLSISSWAELR